MKRQHHPLRRGGKPLKLERLESRVLLAADTAFGGAFSSIPLGMKIPGVHWQIKCTPHPRIAEITAGLVRTSFDLRPVDAARSDAFGYRSIMEMIDQVKQACGLCRIASS